LFLIYNCGGPPKRWLRRSSDGGKTWSEPVVPFPSLIGENGFSAFASDSNNVLHLIFSNRTSDSRIHGAWHSEWTGNKWSDPEPIVSGPQTTRFDPNRVSAVVSQGNIILATWRQDPALIGDVSYAYAILDTPQLPLVPLPTPIATVVKETLSPKAEPSPTKAWLPSPVTALPDETVPPVALENNPIMGILIGIFPVLLLMLVYLFRKSFSH